jgi:hypothetical protein
VDQFFQVKKTKYKVDPISQDNRKIHAIAVRKIKIQKEILSTVLASESGKTLEN